jgi:enamine deaminase RidA (YjgF/YER057c/UK114 family)
MPVEHLTPDAVPSAGPPHVSIATGTKLAFFSGQVGRLADGSPAGDTLRAQFTQALRNLAAVASAVGVAPGHFAKTTVYVKDWHPELMDDLYGAVSDYIEDGGSFAEFTASTLVGVAALYEPWCLVEIDAVAVIDS